VINWFLGTQGFSYSDWEGQFYPVGMPSSNYLAHYSRYFNAVEIDASFYGAPRRNTIENWYAVTPRGFKFCLKTPARITHQKRLIEAQDEMQEFLYNIRFLEEKLGIILIQLSPAFHFDQFPILMNFLNGLSKDLNFAIEFRHPSWYRQDTADLLMERNICWATTEFRDLPKDVTLTENFLYVRWMAPRGRFMKYDRERIDVTDKLKWWKEQLLPYLDRVHSVYGFFNDDYAGHAPATCARFKNLLNLAENEHQPPKQGRLL
jgi:uncharacterized protein YecE (DUF72 family)